LYATDAHNLKKGKKKVVTTVGVAGGDFEYTYKNCVYNGEDDSCGWGGNLQLNEHRQKVEGCPALNPKPVNFCPTGKQTTKRQSPIVIDEPFSTGTQTLTINYPTLLLKGLEIDVGASVTLFIPCNTVKQTLTIARGTNKVTYQLRQIHFHTPGEHIIKKKRATVYPFVLHFVHEATTPLKSGFEKLAVLEVNFVSGAKDNPLLSKFSKLATGKGHKEITESTESINLRELIKDAKNDIPSFYNYYGSLTSPPCAEVVDWYVLDIDFPSISEAQIKYLKSLCGENNRPIQNNSPAPKVFKK